MNNFNHTFLMGRATTDIIETNYDGFIRYKFCLAVNYYSHKQKKEYTDFIPVCCWQKYKNKKLDELRKGDTVFVHGRMSTRSYTKNKKKHWITELVGEDYEIIKSKDISDLLKSLKSNKEVVEAILNDDESEISESFKKRLMQTVG